MTHFHYLCSTCGRTFRREEVRYLCPVCGLEYRPDAPLPGVLEVVLDLNEVRRHFDPEHPDWDLFCPVERAFHPDFPVGQTPMPRVPRLGESLGLSGLFIKNDALNPSASLKDRASWLMAAEARRLGESRLIAASTGNAGSALACVAAGCGLEALVFVPAGAPRAKLVQMLTHGAKVVLVKGTYDDAFALSLAYSNTRGGLNRNTAYHPLTLEGKKTVGLEIYAQCGFRAPEVILVAVGDGVILAGIHKAFTDLKGAGLIARLPRLIAVQAATSDAIARYWATGTYANVDPRTRADSISVGVPSNAHLARRALLESEGRAVVVEDRDILEAQLLLARTTGIFAEPAAAAALAGLRQLQASPHRLPQDASVILVVTGHGLKDVEAPMANLSLPEPIEPFLDAVEA